MEQATNKNFTIDAQVREERGTAHSRRLRKQQQKVPAVIYGGKKDARTISIEHKHIIRLVQDPSILTQVLTIKDDSTQEDVLIKAVQRHPAKKQILHVDFVRVDANKEIVVTAPLSFIGEDKSPGVKSGGLVSHIATEVEIKCLPASLPSVIEVDVSSLDVNQTLHISDLKLPAGVSLSVEVDASHNPAIVSIHPKAEEKEIETDAPEAAEAAGPADKKEEEDS